MATKITPKKQLQKIGEETRIKFWKQSETLSFQGANVVFGLSVFLWCCLNSFQFLLRRLW